MEFRRVLFRSEEKERKEAAFGKDAVNTPAYDQSEREHNHANDPERNQLSQDKLPFFYGGNVDLFNGTYFLFADNVPGCDETTHHGQKDHQNAWEIGRASGRERVCPDG